MVHQHCVNWDPDNPTLTSQTSEIAESFVPHCKVMESDLLNAASKCLTEI